MPTNPFNHASAPPANDNTVPDIDMQFLRAAEFGQVEKMDDLLKQGANINARQTNNDTALIIAAREQKFETVKFLLRRKADMTAQNNAGQSALTVAAVHMKMGVPEKNDEFITLLLIKAGAPVNLPENDGSRATHYVVVANRPRVMKALIKAGADLKLPTNRDNTPMMIAAALGDQQAVIDVMLPHDFGINLQDDAKMTALMHAILSRDEPLAEKLIAKNANVLLVDYEGKRALQYAQEAGLAKTLKLLRETEQKIYAPLKEGLAFDVVAPERATFRKKPPAL